MWANVGVHYKTMSNPGEANFTRCTTPLFVGLDVGGTSMKAA